ncbi:MAG: galactokinase family protein [Acidobacteriota bacterium]|nr:galactokinase family protein [Acidobacteriota bacterium]
MPADNFSNSELLKRRFHQLYGEGGVSVLRAPARINILGEHVDYVSYLPTTSLPFGSHEHAMTMVVRPNENGKVRGVSMNEFFAPFEFSLCDIQPPNGEPSWEEFVFNRPVPAPHWSNYVAGAVSFAQWKFGERIQQGFDFLIDSTIPANSGASSSSALVVLAGAAIRKTNQIEFELAELAEDSSQAEWFLGTRGGSLDQTAICLARRHHAVHLSYADHRAEPVPLPSERFRWLTFFTHAADKGREVMLEYNERAAVSRLMIPALIRDLERHDPQRFLDWRYAVTLLGHGTLKTADSLTSLLNQLPETMTLDDFRQLHPRTFQECEAAFPALVSERLHQPLKIRARALYHLGEVWRVNEAVATLRGASANEETAMRQLGKLLNQTHAALRDQYEVSTPQVEQLIELLNADAAVYGARLMGGGFGGNVLALTSAEHVSKLVDRIQQDFYSPQQRDGFSEGSVMISTPGDTLSEL